MSEITPIPKMPFAKMLRYRAEAAVFFTFIGLFRLFGLDGASALGGWLGRNIFYRTRTSQRGRDNLQKAYPEKTSAEIEAILLEMWDNLGRTIAEYAHLDKLSMHGSDPRLQVANIEIVDKAVASGKGVMFVSGHFANWETMPFAAAQHGVEGGEVYRPLNNPYVDRWMVRQRMANGPKDQIAKGAQGTRRIFSLLRAGKSILILVDQKTNEGLPAPFFGRDAMTTPAPAALALKLNCIILPTSNERVGGARFRVTIHPPIEFAPGDDHDQDMHQLTIKITESIEQMVRARPSQWLWIHRRWPKPGDKIRGKRAKALAAQSEA
ncbi:MAG TPA: lysophospholipid acyltransferase family protein [Rhizomicrobium sp.]|jgi:KDO2-lipid IV(A) lauroyltransferase